MSNKSFVKAPPTLDDVFKWMNSSKSINPRTGNPIDRKKKSYKVLNKSYQRFFKTEEYQEYVILQKEKSMKPEDIDPRNPYRNKDGFPIKYDSKTLDEYIGVRRAKLDPILFIPVDEDISIKIATMWDPYHGGKISGIDPIGPLYFHPDTLIKTIYDKKLKGLWNEPIDEEGGYYEGHYGDQLGQGDNDFSLRGQKRPECHIFRYPIEDCYLPKNYNPQFPVLTPFFTFEEVQEIEQKGQLCGNSYITCYGRHRPSLTKLWIYYHRAIAKKPKTDFSKYLCMYIPDKQFEDDLNENQKKYIDIVKESREKNKELSSEEEFIKFMSNDTLFEMNGNDEYDNALNMAIGYVEQIYYRENQLAVDELRKI